MKRFWHVALLEAAYGIIAYQLLNPTRAITWITRYEWQQITWDKTQMLAQEQLLMQNITSLQKVFWKAGLLLLGWFVLHLILYSGFAYLEWAVINHNAFKKREAWRFLGWSVPWLAGWSLLFLGALIALQPGYAYVIVLALVLCGGAISTTCYHGALVSGTPFLKYGRTRWTPLFGGFGLVVLGYALFSQIPGSMDTIIYTLFASSAWRLWVHDKNMNIYK